MNKNAYEIRLDILNTAHNTFMDRYYQKISALRDEASISQTKFDEKLIDSLAPKTEDILAYANKLYQFVDNVQNQTPPPRA